MTHTETIPVTPRNIADFVATAEDLNPEDVLLETEGVAVIHAGGRTLHVSSVVGGQVNFLAGDGARATLSGADIYTAIGVAAALLGL